MGRFNLNYYPKKRQLIGFLITFILILSVYLLTPSWLLNANLIELEGWYPRLGFYYYYFKEYFSPIVGGFFGFIILFHGIISVFRYAKKEKKIIFYVLCLILLFCQFFYSTYKTEFYPAVMLPSFTNGKQDLNKLTYCYSEIVVETKSKRFYYFNSNQVLASIKKSSRVNVSSYTFETPNPELDKDVAFKEWLLKTINEKIPDLEKINKITFYKKENQYKYDKKLILQKSFKTKTNEINF